MKLLHIAVAGSALLAAGTAQADTFVNGGFENGTASGWTTGSGNRNGVQNPLAPANYLPGGSGYQGASTRSAVISSAYVDPIIGAALGSTVYAGNFGYRVEDTATGGLLSVISQTVANYSDSNIFFAWKAVLENGGHAAADSATMVISLRDLTSGLEVIRREYNAGAGGGGVDTRFSQSGSYFYTANWQIEQLAIDSSLSGHTFRLDVLGADCALGGHEGYVYLDGFSNVAITPTGVPEPATWGMMILGFGLVGGAMRRRSTKVAFAA